MIFLSRRRNNTVELIVVARSVNLGGQAPPPVSALGLLASLQLKHDQHRNPRSFQGLFETLEFLHE